MLSPSCYPCQRRDPTPRHTQARFESLLLTRASTKLLLTIALSRRGDFDNYYPACIADEFLDLLGDVVEEQAGSHIDLPVQQLTLKLGYVRLLPGHMDTETDIVGFPFGIQHLGLCSVIVLHRTITKGIKGLVS